MAPAFAVLAVLAAFGAACNRSAGPDPQQTRERAAEIIGVLKLVRQEYANAVPPAGGSVVDEIEYAETELFAEQAEAKVRQLETTGAFATPERAATVRDAVARMRTGVTEKVAQADVSRDAGIAIDGVEELLAGAVPDLIRGAVMATAKADQTIAAEEVVGEYRIGVASTPARQIFRREGGSLVAVPPPPGTAYVAVLVRERRTKRFLPAQAVTLTIAGAGRSIETPLAELWGDYHQYGANVVLPPDGPVTLTVAVSAPAYARHGDMLTHFVAPATATLTGAVRDGALTFDARPILPIDGDYAIGDDLMQANAEAGTLYDAGPYRVGVIVEAPEPIWTWKDGAPVLKPVADGATNHVEVVLVDRASGQLVPNADVRLTFLDGNGGTKADAALHPLLSAFSHYGETLTVPPGTTKVRVHVGAPNLGSIDAPRLGESADIELALPKRRGAA